MTPILELMLLGYAMDLTVDHIPTALADMSLDAESRAFTRALSATGYFDIQIVSNGEADVMRSIDEGRAQAGIVIPPDLEAHLQRGDAQILVLLDGSDSFAVRSGYSAVTAIAQARAMEIRAQQVNRMGMEASTLPISSSVRVLYNPNMDDMIFLVPALAAMLMQLVSINLTVMAVVRERESGTLEQVLITPARPMELMISKMLPNIVLTVLNTLTIVLIGIFWFGVPFKGDPWLFALVSLLFIVSALGLGLFISTLAQSQKQAQQLTSLILLLNMLLTGFIFPRTPMPAVVRAVGSLIPLTYFIRIMRGIFTKGVGLSFMWQDVVALLMYGILIMTLASASFKNRLD
jgi:ABC-2 type transport system permease protein